ncbi:MAG: glycosyltransferase [Sphingomonadales bacterium]
MTQDPPFDLSVVIVNYNVVNFLEQCLNSVFAASKQLQIEVFVVDNNNPMARRYGVHSPHSARGLKRWHPPTARDRSFSPRPTTTCHR